MEQNFDGFIGLVWPSNGDFDSPLQGYHVTPGDPGGGTKGGVIEATWQAQVKAGEVTGSLAGATDAQLRLVLRNVAWGAEGDALPPGVDIMVANGKMMTGHYSAIVENCIGMIGASVDNVIGPNDLVAIAKMDPYSLIMALHGNHYAYLSQLPTWSRFKNGWTRRLMAAHDTALAAVTPAAKPA